MGRTIQATIKVTTKDLFLFMLQHTYKSVSGVLSVLISLLALIWLLATWGTLDTSYMVLLAVGASLFTIINPCMLYTRAAKQMVLSPAMKTSIQYMFMEEEFSMKQGENEAKAKYSDLYKVKVTKNYIYLYGTRTRANIIEKQQLGEQAKEVEALVLKGNV